MNNYWKDKESRARKALDHTAEMSVEYAEQIRNSIVNETVYSNGFGSNFKYDEVLSNNNMIINIENMDSVTAIMKYCYGNNKVAVLNFASYKNPGGMFINGSSAQEESLCMESFLYNVLKENMEYYYCNNHNKNKALYTNRALYNPDILFFRDNNTKSCNVITCAAPNLTTAQKYCNVSREENTEILKSRIKFVLDIAMDQKIDTLILGAFGCGVFGQDPIEVARIFKMFLYDTHKVFNNVVFAIPGGYNLNCFRKVFMTED